MHIQLPYGSSTLSGNLDFVSRPRQLLPPDLGELPDPVAATREVLENPLGTEPLREILHRGERTTIVVPDASRVAGQRVYLPVLIDVLNQCGIADRDVTILIATGSHALPTDEEKRELVGEEIAARVRVLAHDCRDADANVRLGRTAAGVPVIIDQAVVKAERLIVTGAVWFHYFAGFGGGPKLVNPGCAAYETIVANHAFTLDPERVGLHPNCRPGQTEGNPVFEDLLDSLKFVTVDFSLQTVVGKGGKLVQIWGGDIRQVHRTAAEFLLQHATVPAQGPFPLVVASAGGDPYDINLVQAHKSLVNATRFAREGGVIVWLAECRGGAGSWGLEQSLQYPDPETLYRNLRQEFVLNGNTALSLMLKARAYNVILVSDLPPDWVRRLGITPASDLSEALDLAKDKLEQVDEALVLPYAAQTVALA